MEMEDQYNISDLRQLMNGSRNLFPTLPLQAATDLFPNHRPPPPPPPHQHHQLHPHPYEHLMMMGGSGRHQAHELNNIPRGLHHHHEFRSPDSSAAGGGGTSNTTSGAAAPSLSGGGGLMEAEIGADIGGSGRWPRQETLTLLEIRSRLDFKFKEANQKGPLWDEVSRIMCEEHGYQRSGKKCREKFENLYKYYKKTKEGKAGRQDGKHYRFFRQLEALYGDATTTNAAASSPSLPEAHFIGNTNNNTTNLRFQTAREAHHHQKHCESLSISNNSSEFDTSSSEDRENNDVMDGDSQMRKRKGRGWKAKIKEFIDTHMRKLMEKQEEWMDRLMRTIEQKEKERTARDEEWRKSEIERVEREHKFWAKERAWIESRDKALMEALHKMTGSSSTTTDNNNNNNNNSNAQEIKGEEETKELLVRKKRKDNANSRGYFGNNNESSSSLYCGEMSNEHGGNEGSDSPSCRNANHVVGNENCFPFLMGEGDNLWENYGLKLSKASQNQQ